MTDESLVRTRAFQLWDIKGRLPGSLNECLEEARRELNQQAIRDSLAGDATAPPPSQTRPGQLFTDPDDERASIDRRGRDIEVEAEPKLMRTQTQGAPEE
ncbi:hypothetical protein [Niveispirillum sp. KHB5.9]|uniref:hypothetical protein n=1 Tax=Niveispirillum sp. KHB5.9 TaxID=3400269 RepID=UPI003A876BAC